MTAWMAFTMSDIFNSPADYPFCLNEQEFAFYAKVNFGDEMGKLPASFKPPSFYRALLGDSIGIFVAAGVGASLVYFIPEWATAGAVAKLAPGAARSAVGGVVGAFVKEALPGNAVEAFRKDRLWKRYTLELQRRSL